MILIAKNQTKKVYFRLNPTSITPLNYLFEFKSNDTGNLSYMISPDNSPHPQQYNSFTFSEGSTASFSGGIMLEPGTYDYQIYQTQFLNLNPASASGLLEVGLMTVLGNDGFCAYGTASTDYVYYDPTPPAVCIYP